MRYNYRGITQESGIMMKVPFGLHQKSKRYMGIDEVANGLDCDCICPSCHMSLKARHGCRRDHHFAHHKAAQQSCEYSFWVAVRSMAKQLLEENSILLPKYLTKITPFFEPLFEPPFCHITIHQITADPCIPHYQFDLEVVSSIGTFYIYFLTDADDTGRERSHFHDRHDYCCTQLIVEIDLSTMKAARNQPEQYLRELLFTTISNKQLVTPLCPFESVEREPHDPSPVADQQALDAIKIFLNITDDTHDSTLQGYIDAMRIFYQKALLEQQSNLAPTDSFTVLHRKNGTFYFGKYGEEYYAVVAIEDIVLIYTLEHEEIQLIQKLNTFCTKAISQALNEYKDFFEDFEDIDHHST